MLTLVTGGARSGKSGFAEKLVMHESSGGAAIYIATAQAYDDEMRDRIGLHRQMREDSGFAWTTVEEPYKLSALLRRLGEGSCGINLEHAGRVDAGRSLVNKGKPDVSAGRGGLNCESAGGTRLGGAESVSAIGTSPKGSADGASRRGSEDKPDADAKSPAVLVDCLTLWLSNRLLALEHDPERDRLLREESDELVQAAAAYPGALTLVTNEVGSGLVPEYELGRLFRDWAGRLNRLLAERAERVFLVACGIPVELKSLQYRMGSGD